MPPKITKMENIAAQDMRYSIQKDRYIDANQESTRCGNHPITPALWKIGENSHFSPLFSKT
jgi:hypothetical protein